MNSLLIGDILERDLSGKKPAEPPSAPDSATGFPQHRRRWKPSAFKQQRSGLNTTAMAQNERLRQSASSDAAPNTSHADDASSFEAVERRRIDQENRQKIDSMTPQEISRAQEDLLNGLNPNLIQRLLRRANIDEPDPTSPFNVPVTEPPESPPQPRPQPDTRPGPKKVEVEEVADESATVDATPHHSASSPAPSTQSSTRPTSTGNKKIADNYDEDQAPAQIPPDLFPIVDLPRSTHFPVPPSLPDLDPSDPNFLATLHEKYFPNLPADPSKLAWMAPVPSQDSVADRESPYYPHPEISVAALRFDFRGRFLSPRVSRTIPASRGLHHHGEAPEAAGYTVAELARLARSAVPAQRCMAFQTLGRVLYRLGCGEWGSGVGDPIAMGVWRSVKEGRVLETLMDASQGEGGHRGSRAYALEALWLFEKGGWREKSQGR